MSEIKPVRPGEREVVSTISIKVETLETRTTGGTDFTRKDLEG